MHNSFVIKFFSAQLSLIIIVQSFGIHVEQFHNIFVYSDIIQGIKTHKIQHT